MGLPVANSSSINCTHPDAILRSNENGEKVPVNIESFPAKMSTVPSGGPYVEKIFTLY